MKAIKSSFICTIIILASLILFACTKVILPESITMATPEVEIFLGNTKYLNVEVLPEDANKYTFVWSTSDKTIVSVNNRGQITAKAYGQATITCNIKDTDIKAECLVNVTDGKIYKATFNSESVKKEYYSGQTFDSTGLIVTAYYESGVKKQLDSTQYQLDCPDVLTEDSTVSISVGKFTHSFDITVIPDIPTSISISSVPLKTTYYVGEIFNPEGMQISLNYASGKSETITDYTFNQSPLSYDTTSLKISYGEFYTYQPITIKSTIVINDISLLQDAINNASDCDSIMIKEGTYNTTTTINIPSSKNITIYGENENVTINGYGCSIFTITDTQTRSNITIARLKLVVADGNNPLISNPNNISINLININS